MAVDCRGQRVGMEVIRGKALVAQQVGGALADLPLILNSLRSAPFQGACSVLRESAFLVGTSLQPLSRASSRSRPVPSRSDAMWDDFMHNPWSQISTVSSN